MKTSIYILSALAAAASLSFGQDQAPGGPGGPGKHERPNPEEMFKKLDTNSDGALSLDEFKASPRGQKDPAKAEEIFKKIDTDANGSLSLEEFKAHRPPHPPGGPGGPGGPGKGRGPGKGNGGAPPPDAPPAE